MDLSSKNLQKCMTIIANIVIAISIIITIYFCFCMGSILIIQGTLSSSFLVGCVPFCIGIIFHTCSACLTISLADTFFSIQS